MNRPSRGEVWLISLDPVQGHEQAGTRPALVVSVDAFNHSLADLAVVLPITSKSKAQPFHVQIEPPEASLTVRSYIKCDDVCSVAISRFQRHFGRVKPATLDAAEDRLRILLGLGGLPCTP